MVKLPSRTSSAFFKAANAPWTPEEVLWTTILSWKMDGSWSRSWLGEFPKSNPSIGAPPTSPMSMRFGSFSLSASASFGVATNSECLIPNEKSRGAQVNALNTSMTTVNPRAFKAPVSRLSQVTFMICFQPPSLLFA